MTTPEGRTPHPVEPAEGAEDPGRSDAQDRSEHSVEPAEGPDDPEVTEQTG